MTSLSSNLNLTLYSSGSADQSGSFITWTQNMSGSVDSNMVKIDNWSGSASGSITALTSATSASMTAINAQLTGISGSITTLNANILNLQQRLYKIAEFSGSGQADFNNISGSWTNLVLMGVAACNLTGQEYDVVCDFNGDSVTANYAAVQWHRHLLPTDAEFITEYDTGGIWIGKTTGTNWGNYGAPIFAIIPNYSGSAGFYKSAMGFSGFYPLGAALQGGVWKFTNPITRVRVFAVTTSTARLNFGSGTKLTLYGFG